MGNVVNMWFDILKGVYDDRVKDFFIKALEEIFDDVVEEFGATGQKITITQPFVYGSYSNELIIEIENTFANSPDWVRVSFKIPSIEISPIYFEYDTHTKVLDKLKILNKKLSKPDTEIEHTWVSFRKWYRDTIREVMW